VFTANREHWTIENRCHWGIHWNFDKDRSRIRPNERVAPAPLRSRRADNAVRWQTSIKEKIAKLNRNTRMVFDYLYMTKNLTRQTAAWAFVRDQFTESVALPSGLQSH